MSQLTKPIKLGRLPNAKKKVMHIKTNYAKVLPLFSTVVELQITVIGAFDVVIAT